MKNVTLIIALFLVFISSCKKEDKDKEPVYKGDITLSSEIFFSTTYYSFGFSFENEKFVSTMSPPIVIDLGLNRDGQFTSKEIPGTTYGLYLNGTFANAAEALDFYNNYHQATLPSGTYLTDSISANRVYTLRTYKKNYVKILIKNFRIVTKNEVEHFEADLKYYIQRDGSATFAE